MPPHQLSASRDLKLTSGTTNVYLSPFEFEANTADAMLEALNTERRQEMDNSAPLITKKRGQIDQIEGRMRRLLELRIDGEIDSKSYLRKKALFMSQKRTLNEQAAALNCGEKPWLEPLKNWIREAKNLKTIKQTGSLIEKAGIARKIFGSNLVLGGKKARGIAVNPWAILADNELSHDVVRTLNAARTLFQEMYPS